MKRWSLLVLALTLLAVGNSACATGFETKHALPAELGAIDEKKLYDEADYFAYIITDNKILAGFLVSHRQKYYVITAGHVQYPHEKMREIKATFKKDKKKAYAMEILAIDRDYDTAILGFKDQNFKFNGKVGILGDSDDIQKDDRVYSLGHPRKHTWYFSKGRILRTSYKPNGESVEVKDVFLHSALGGPGSSGGPVLNANGEIIGMNILMRANENSEYSNRIGATHINNIKRLLDPLK